MPQYQYSGNLSFTEGTLRNTLTQYPNAQPADPVNYSDHQIKWQSRLYISAVSKARVSIAGDGVRQLTENLVQLYVLVREWRYS